MKWKIEQLIAMGALGVVDLVLVLSGASISTATGIPLAGGVINNIFSRSRKRKTGLMLNDLSRAPQAFNRTTEQECDTT
ncbi:MAG: hypothetical protein HND47_24685 [Chloroflexi bacterium]|nr:hypothetical protein [Chloroflexota bacterium]